MDGPGRIAAPCTSASGTLPPVACQLCEDAGPSVVTRSSKVTRLRRLR